MIADVNLRCGPSIQRYEAINGVNVTVQADSQFPVGRATTIYLVAEDRAVNEKGEPAPNVASCGLTIQVRRTAATPRANASSAFLSALLPVLVSLSLSLSVCVCVCVCVCVSLSLSLSFCICLYACVSACTFHCPSPALSLSRLVVIPERSIRQALAHHHPPFRVRALLLRLRGQGGLFEAVGFVGGGDVAIRAGPERTFEGARFEAGRVAVELGNPRFPLSLPLCTTHRHHSSHFKNTQHGGANIVWRMCG
eukprot:COSAG05_NODE_3744_length_1865_cov_1.897508_2_plen_252_part_00